jgi:serine/threonine-protein kinase
MSVGLASIFGILPQGTIASLNLVGLTPKLLCLAICEGMIVLAFVFGRRFRAHALLGLEAHARVVRDNARREALLEEAVEELNRVRRVGDPGRFTGLSIGSFDVGVVLGRGGMGEVYEAVHSTSGQPAALKVLAVAGSPDEQTVARFRREIMLAAQINDLHVVRVLEHSSAEASLLYLAMERLVGSSLAEELRDVRRPPVRVVLKMLQHVAQGVSAAHALGIVHRDLTPQNIFHHRAAGEDVWKILDFGIARWAGAESELTKNAIVGTPSYMSPEQVLGGGLDARSDLFSLGAVAYRCLTGRPAFHGAAADTMYHIVQDMPMQPSRLAALPPEVDLVLALVFAKAPEDRLDSALSFVEALTAALHGQIEPALEARAKQLLASKPWT